MSDFGDDEDDVGLSLPSHAARARAAARWLVRIAVDDRYDEVAAWHWSRAERWLARSTTPQLHEGPR